MRRNAKAIAAISALLLLTCALGAMSATAAAPVVTIDVPSAITAGSAHVSGTVNPEDQETSYRFQYSADGGSSWSDGAFQGPLAAGAGDTAVADDLTGLKPGTEYAVRLLAESADGQTLSAEPNPSFTTDTTAAQILSTAASSLYAEATLSGSVNPGGLATTYRFEYGPTTSYGQSTPAKSIPAGGDPVTVKANLFGLTPAGGYHFRLLVSNAEGSDESADRAFSTLSREAPEGNCPNEAIRVEQNATRLPECRAFEQVSPVDKNGVGVTNFLRLSANGRGIAWMSLGAHSGSRGSNAITPYASWRTATGWLTEPFNPPYNSEVHPDVFSGLKGYVFPGDLATMVFGSNGRFSPDDLDAYSGLPLGPTDIYRIDRSGQVSFLSRGQGVEANGFGEASLVAVSEDGSSVFFRGGEPFTTAALAAPFSEQLYRWRDGTLEAVGLDSNDQLLDGGSWLGSGASASLAGAGDAGKEPDAFAVSADGSRFVYSGTSATAPVPEVYLHEDGTTPRMLSRSQRDATAGQPSATEAVFLWANEGFTKVYFVSNDQLTDAAPAEGGLYVYDVESEVLRFLMPDDSLLSGVFDIGSAGVTGISEDGSYIYFVSQRDLASGAVAGERNLYCFHAGATSFVATLSNEDLEVAATPKSAAQAFNPAYTRANVSADGTRLVFESKASLAGADANGHSVIYVYDARTESLSCVSCRDDGGASQGDSTLRVQENEYRVTTPDAISPDGRAIVFSSRDQLVPRDTNDQWDVYESRDGRLKLVSSGTSNASSVFVGLSPDGTDLYFKTAQALAATDTDGGLHDYYDARVDGGFAAPSPPVDCGSGCRGPLGQAPSAQRPSTAALSSPGNAAHRHRKKHAKRKHAKRKHAKRKHAKRKHAKKRAQKRRSHSQERGHRQLRVSR